MDSQTIKKSRPPNFAKIVDVFPIARSPSVIFAYAPHIYAPNGQIIPNSLMEHEGVHIERQKRMGIEAWWDRYLVDLPFRFEEELLAHKKEYQVLKMSSRTWKAERVSLKMVAKKLASPLYGRMVSTEQAMKLLEA